MKKKTFWFAVCICMLVIAGLTAVCGTWKTGRSVQQPAYHLLSAAETEEGIEIEIAGENLLLKEDVRMTADSEESKDFSAKWAADGITDESTLRWSSENDWEDHDHWLQAAFPQPTQIGYVKIFWERTNADRYALEYSQDGKSWETAVLFENAPRQNEQRICLEEPVTAAYLRLHVMDVKKEETDLSLYYQNVSVMELEVYEAVVDRFVVVKPQIEAGTDRILPLPQAPEGYEISFAGADYENLITSDRQIADTLSDVTAEIGFCLNKDGISWELPGMELCIPASKPAESAALPIDVMEWKADGGSLQLEKKAQVIVSAKEQELLGDTAALFLEELAQKTYGSRIRLTLAQEQENSLGLEGYEIQIKEDGITILGNTAQGVRWGCVTLMELLDNSQAAEKSTAAEAAARLPLGTIRDYPRYPVRGFGIDVGRRAISMDLLYEIVREMSAQKMNTLQIHLNDNQIIAQSAYDGTVEGARALYAGFRLESDIKNEAGVGITSQDLFYTKEDFMQLIEDAAVYGVEIVPEIDMPAHSLAFTKVFPELGFSKDPESIDQLDLSKEEARQLGKEIWAEYLTAEGTDAADGAAALQGSVFENCSALHLGMDEYYGKEEAYVAYLQELSEYVKQLAPEKELRIWGSLSKLDTDYSQISRDLQMHIWDTDWADPGDMYAEGFSIVNSLSSSLYIIPGGGYDELDLTFLQEQWQPNLFLTKERTWVLPAWSDRMLGACYMMWNDWSWMNGDEITEESLLERFKKPLPVLAKKLWGTGRNVIMEEKEVF